MHLPDVPEDILEKIIQFLNLAEVQLLLCRVNKKFRDSLSYLENRTCSNAHKFPHHIWLCTCQVYVGFEQFCRKITPPHGDVCQRAINMQRAWQHLQLPTNWDDAIVKSYIQTGKPSHMMMCIEPHLLALVAIHKNQEVGFLLAAYMRYGIKGKLPDWKRVRTFRPSG